jgi:hypothetical protein
MLISRWKSCPTKAGAGRSAPSLAGVAVTRGLKRRQGSCGVREVSLEMKEIAGAEPFITVEGNRVAVEMPGNALPPGSEVRLTHERSASEPRRPCRVRREVPTGVVRLRGKTGAAHRAEAGSRTGP